MQPISLTLHPELSPAVCTRCGAGDTLDQLGQRMRAFFIDTGVEMEVEGRLYLCNMCIRDIVDYVPDVVSMKRYLALWDEKEAALAELEKIERVKERLATLGIRWEVFEGDEDGPSRVHDEPSNQTDNSSGEEPTSDGTESESDSALASFTAPSLSI